MVHLRSYAWMLLLGILWWTGCHQGSAIVDKALEPATRLQTQAPTGYLPADVTILPITALSTPESSQNDPYIHVYVGLLDMYQCHLKAPGTFRFELYERVPRSGRSQGKRLSIWPDILLLEPEDNQRYWRDYLRSYEFRLDLNPGVQQTQDAILQVTFLTTDDRRIVNQFSLGEDKR
ncbi:hypothetical protein ACFL6U_21425 [Planctomycetota bacterium]